MTMLRKMVVMLDVAMTMLMKFCADAGGGSDDIQESGGDAEVGRALLPTWVGVLSEKGFAVNYSRLDTSGIVPNFIVSIKKIYLALFTEEV